MASSSASSSLSRDRDSFEELSQESQDQDINNDVHLKVTVQPCKYFRFRYISELKDTHGFITGISDKNTRKYPTVELCNYGGDAVIKCSLAQWNNDKLHVHSLAKNSDIVADVGPELGYTVIFQNLNVIMRRKVEINEMLLKENAGVSEQELKELYSNIEMNKARLKFTAHDPNNTDISICPPVYSTVINSQKHASTKNLKICRASRARGSCLGGDEIYLLVDKVNNNVGVRVVQKNGCQETIWSAECIFDKKEDVHFQVAIVVITPPYHNTNIDKDVNVFIELYRNNEARDRSNLVPFTYTPIFILDSYRTIADNVVHPLDPPSVPLKFNEHQYEDMNSGPLLPNINLNNQLPNKNSSDQFALYDDDYLKPLQSQFDTSDYDMIDAEDITNFAGTYLNAKDYPGYGDLQGNIMGLNFGPNLKPDGIVRKPKTKTSAYIRRGKYKTRVYMDPASDYEYDEIDIPPNWRPDNSEHNYCSTRPGGVATRRPRGQRSSEEVSAGTTKGQRSSDKEKHAKGPKSSDNERHRTNKGPKSSQGESTDTAKGQNFSFTDEESLDSFIKESHGTANGQRSIDKEKHATGPKSSDRESTDTAEGLSYKDTEEESLDSFNKSSETETEQTLTSNDFQITAKVENTSDIDIEETGFDSYDDSDAERESNHSTSSQIDIGMALKEITISTTKADHDRKLTGAKNSGSEMNEIDARLLDAIEKDDEALLEDLLDEGLSPCVCDKNGNNAVHCAVQSNSCLPLLLKVCKGRLGEVINAWNCDTKTPLHIAASQNSPKKVKLLLSHSARYDLLDDDGRSPLHLAAAGGHLEVVETLLDCVPDIEINRVDGKGQTALQLVCAAEDDPDNRAIVELLLEKGADASAAAAGDLSAMQLANDKPKMMKILQTYVFS